MTLFGIHVNSMDKDGCKANSLDGAPVGSIDEIAIDEQARFEGDFS
jgi:hypothetical protein